MSRKQKIAVLGSGAWGTALALAQARADRNVVLWSRNADAARQIHEQRANEAYLPGIRFDAPLLVTADASAALDEATMILAAIPAQSLRDGLAALAPHVPVNVPIALCAKGIEKTTGKLMSAVLAGCLPGNPAAALSGPSFAADVARGLPTAVTVAAEDIELAGELAAALSTPVLRCYSSDDLIGVETGGALKNVLAIAAGAVRGAGLGASAEASLVTRGFVELRRIGAALGARPETMMGLSGLGDLMLTCSSPQSRNLSYGIALGRGESLGNRPLAEGAATAGIAAREAMRLGVEAPIITATAAILDGKLTIGDAVKSLLSRPLKSEDS
jgi:glycerol-3-phosphate dehydrogenase (NAD(P)+)